MPAASETEIPPWLEKAIAKFPADLKEKVSALHGKYRFDEDAIDLFEVNTSERLSLANVLAFGTSLEKTEKDRIQNTGTKPEKGEKTAKRKSGSGLKSTAPKLTVQLPRGALGLPQRAHADVTTPKLPRSALPLPQHTDVTTPDPKRMREAHAGDVADSRDADMYPREPARGTPDPLVKPMQVTLRTSLNEQLVKPQKPSAGGGGLRWDFIGNDKLWKGKSGDRSAYHWMDESIEERAGCLDERLATMEADIANEICSRHASSNGGIPPAVGAVGSTSQAEVVLCGRIACEGLEGKLNERSLLIEGSRASSAAASMRLNVNECPRVTLFPGQIVGVLGRSGMSGTTFHARDMVDGLPVLPRVATRGGTPLHILVASGPYCLRDALLYDPLARVLEHAAHEKPDVLFLLGPFLDASNKQVATGETKLPNKDEPCAFEDIYTHHVLNLLHRHLVSLKRESPNTKVMIVPSLDEVLCFHPMPQPPLDVSLGLDEPMEKLRRLGVQFLPNPAHISVAGGLRISVTSSDALSPLLRDMVLRPESKNKIQESLRQLLLQRTLFPVLPRDPAHVSEARASSLNFPDGNVPDVCIFPSQIGGLAGLFVDDVAFVNPGSVCKPMALGTFAEFWVMPPQGSEPFNDRVRIDIQKLS